MKNLPAMRKTWVPSLGWEDPLEEGMATHSSILAWRIPVDRGTWHAAVHGLTESWTQLSDQVAAADPDKPRLAVTTIAGQNGM